jgi:hypothetical protein
VVKRGVELLEPVSQCGDLTAERLGGGIDIDADVATG